MSYARFSSMNWRSDVYVYEDARGGWTTHIAARRGVMQPIPDFPLLWLPRFGGRWSNEELRTLYPSRWHAGAAHIVFWVAAVWHNKVHMLSLRLIPLRPIGLPFDGETFNDPTPTACADRLEYLRQTGYVVPQSAIDALRLEAVQAPTC